MGRVYHISGSPTSRRFSRAYESIAELNDYKSDLFTEMKTHLKHRNLSEAKWCLRMIDKYNKSLNRYASMGFIIN